VVVRHGQKDDKQTGNSYIPSKLCTCIGITFYNIPN